MSTCARSLSRSGADLVFLDLEDACAPSAKESARAIAVNALTGLDWGRALRAVRINGLDTPWCHDDIVEVVTGARDALDVIIVPKVLSARDVWWVDVLLTQLEAKLRLQRPIALEALIEEAEGLVNVVEISRASPRLEALIFGAGDLSASLRSRVDGNFQPAGEYPGDFWHLVRMQVLTAARAPGSTQSTRRTPDTRTSTVTAAPQRMPACSGSTASGRFIPPRCPSPMRSSPRQPRRSPTPVRSSPTTAKPKRAVWAPSGATADSSTPR